MHDEGDGAPRDPLLPPASADSIIPGMPTAAVCERCGSRGLDGVTVANYVPLEVGSACLFCQDADGASYVPVHLAAGDVPSGDDTPSDGESGGRPHRRRGGGQHLHVPYSGALESHRGCGHCWLRWEAQQIEAAAEAGERIEVAVKCPVCNLSVDIRRAYDEALCTPCQRQVVARGNKAALIVAKAKSCMHRCRGVAALALLCTVFGVQALFSMVLWEIFEVQIGKAAEDPGSFMFNGGHKGQHGAGGNHGGDGGLSVFNISVAAAAAAGIFMS